MKKNLIEKINKFCSYLNDWENKKDYYVNELLPNWVDCYISGLTIEARTLFLEIRQETSVDEWNNIIKLIVEIKEHYDDIIKQNEINTRKDKLDSLFKKLKQNYNFDGFIHTTNFDNFINIMYSDAIYSRNYIEKHHIEHTEIALPQVIEKTNHFYKNYVRFYWRVKTPTNFRNEGIKPKIALKYNNFAHSANPVIFIFEPKIAFDENTLFTNVNAAIHDVEAKPIPDSSFDFRHIFHCGSIEDEFLKTKIIPARCAEFLYPKEISIKKCSKIIFRNIADYERAILILGYKDERFCVDEHQFLNNWLSVSTYKYKITSDNINLQISYNFGNELYQKGYSLIDFSHNFKFLDNSEQEIINYKKELNRFDRDINFECKINQNYKMLCYYIDNIECIRIKIND